MASTSSQQPPMSEPDILDHCSTSPSETQPDNPEDQLHVEEEPNLESTTVDEIKTGLKIENKTPKSRGRPKKKEKHKQPVSESKLKLEAGNGCDRPDYSFQFQDETRNVFMPSELVWGKVKNYPWWPGMIFDPSCASELALKHRNKNNFLVAYFYDNTFAWNEAPVLKPFRSNFSRMVKQSSTESFMSAVEEALAEVSRRVGSALSCGCYNSRESSIETKFVNAGIQANTARPSGDGKFIRSSFDQVKFLEFLSDLGQNPYGDFGRLDLVIAKSQLKAFNQSRGCGSDLPEFNFTSAFDEVTTSLITSDRIYYPRKRKSIDGDSSEEPILKKHVPEEGRKKKKLSEIYNKKQMMRTPKQCKVRVGGPSGSDNSGKYKKKSLDSLGDLGTKPKARRRYLRVGQCMRKAENQVTHTRPAPKPNGMTSRKRKSLSMIKDRVEKKPFLKENGIVLSDNLSRVKSGTKKKRVSKRREDDANSFILEKFSSSNDMLTQLYLVAEEPLKNYSFITMIVSLFTRFRNDMINPIAGKRSQQSLFSGKSNLVEDEVWDSCISDSIADDVDNEKLITLRHNKKISRMGIKENISANSGVNPNGDLKNENKECNLGNSGAKPNGDLETENKQDCNLGTSDANGHEQTPDLEDSTPTALLLNFEETVQLPTKPELNGIFTKFGPLKEAETEVSEKENVAQVVFKKHVDAEMAFNNAGKLDAFRSDLVSFQLSCAPASSNMETTTTQVELQGERDAAAAVNAAC